MFRVLSQQLAWWPVSWPGVTEDGTVITNQISMRFLILDEDEIVDFQARNNPPVTEEEKKLSPSLRAARVFMGIVKDWKAVGAENGEPLPFNEENFARLLRLPNVAGAIANAYTACRAAEPETRTGN